MLLIKYVHVYIRIMRATDQIKHIGTILSIEGNLLHVKMLQSSACSGCHAAKLCQSSETKEKIVDVVSDHADQYSQGQNVMLIGSVHQGLKATLWAYVIPVILLVLTLCVAIIMGYTETFSATCSLGSVAVYFIILYFFRDKFRNKFSFEIQSLHPNA